MIYQYLFFVCLFSIIHTSISFRSLSQLNILNKILKSHKHSIDVPPLNKEKPLKVMLIVEPTPFNYISGYANRFKEMLKYLHKATDDVHVITTDNDPQAPKTFLGFNITTLPGLSFPLYKHVKVSLDPFLQIRKQILTFKPELIHVSTPSLIMFPTIFWAKWYKIPLVMSYHTDLVNYTQSYFPILLGLSKWLVKYYHQKADLVLCTSPQLKEAMDEAGIKRVDVWQKGINTEIFAPHFKNNKTREFLSQNNTEHPLLLYVGRLGIEKKLHRLKKVLDAIPNARLALVGQGPAENELKQLFKDYHVHFTGQITGLELSKIFASADLFLMPSDTETLGFVVLESLASGVPAIGVKAGGLVDIIENNETGYLVENNEDMIEFTEKVKDLIENKEKRKTFGEAALQWSLKWSWEGATSKLRNIQYRKAIKNHNSS